MNLLSLVPAWCRACMIAVLPDERGAPCPDKFFRSAVSSDLRELPKIDTSVAHIARVYDYWLGGKDNFAIDREIGQKALQAHPETVLSVQANRRFLARSVRHLAAEEGVRQFLDVGTGLPSANNTHEVAQAVAPESRVFYVDNDPIVLAHARALLTSSAEGETPIPTPTPPTA